MEIYDFFTVNKSKQADSLFFDALIGNAIKFSFGQNQLDYTSDFWPTPLI